MRAAWCAAVCATSCVPAFSSDLNLESTGVGDAKLAVVAVGDPDEPARSVVYTFDPRSEALPSFAVHEGARIELLLYPYTREELQLGERSGVITSLPGDGPARTFPTADRTVLSAPVRAGPFAWTKLDAPSRVLGSFRLPLFDLNRCARAGCLDPQATGALDVCKIPCPAPIEVTPPAPVEAPRAVSTVVLTPCPAGWSTETSTRSGAITVCEPPPRAMALHCAVHEVQHFGSATCERVGAACPAGDWPALPEDPAPIYVDDGAAAGGDGSRATPFDTIGAALRSGADTSRPIAVAAGTYHESVFADRPARLFGACVERTKIEFAGDTVSVEAPGFELHDVELHLTGAGAGLTVTSSGASALLEGVSVHGEAPLSFGVVATLGAHVTTRDVVLRNLSGLGVSMQSGSTFDLRRTVVEDTANYGFHIAGARGELREVVTRRTYAAPSSPRGGHALTAAADAHLEVHGGLFEQATSSAVQVVASEARFDDVVIADVRTSIDIENGFGIVVAGAADLELDGVVIEGARAHGLVLLGPDSRATVRTSLIRDIAATAADFAGTGIEMSPTTSLLLEKTRIENTGAQAINMTGAAMVASDLAILETRGPAGGQDGTGLRMSEVSTATVTRLLVERARTFGVLAFSASRARLDDATVVDTRVQASDGNEGWSVVTGDRGSIALHRAQITRSSERAIHIGTGSSITAEDVHISENGRDEAGIGSNAIVFERSTGRFERVLIERSIGVCVFVYAFESSASVRDLECREMRARATAADSEALGIVSSGGVDAVFERVKLSGIEGPAISLEQAAELVASDVAIERAEKDCIRIHGANGDFTRVSIDGCEGDALFIRNSINTRTAITRVTATFSDLAISGTTQQSRAGDAPAAPKEADDAAVHVGKFADVTLRRFRITDNEVRAGRIEATARLFLEGGRVERNTSGMEVEDPDLDLADLLIGVSYDENGGGPAFIPRISGE